MRSKTVVWIPVLFVGALLFWTLAFGFGGMSLMAFTLYQDCPESTDEGAATLVKDSYQSITVNLSDLPPGPAEAEDERAEAQAGPGQETAAVTVDLVPDHDSQSDQVGQGARGGGQHRDQGPGQTAF